MSLDIETTDKIKNFVRIKPRTIQEIALFIGKNWRTANSYVEKISKETGEISYRVLRSGTPGALKIVYWNNLEQINHTQTQERLFRQIEIGKDVEDFSPFDVYQYVDEKKKNAFIETQAEENINVKQDLVGTLRSAEKQVLFFSKNLSWANVKQKNIKIIEVFKELVEKGISIKFLSDINISNIENAQKLTALNDIFGKDLIEIRHCKHPLRAFIVDDKVMKFKERREPSKDKNSKFKKESYLFYEIYDKEWIEWMQKVFWGLFRTSMPVYKRIKELKTIGGLKSI